MSHGESSPQKNEGIMNQRGEEIVADVNTSPSTKNWNGVSLVHRKRKNKRKGKAQSSIGGALPVLDVPGRKRSKGGGALFV